MTKHNNMKSNTIDPVRRIFLPFLRSKFLLPMLFPFFCFPLQAQNEEVNWQKLEEMVRQSPAFNLGFTGFSLYDPDEKKWLCGVHETKFFTPASNTKIFTFLTAVQVLGDSLPLAHFLVLGDTLLFWGTGNPAWLYAELPVEDPLTPLLKAWPGPLFYTGFTFQTDRFGPGWAWGDYPYSYQVERTPMPYNGNLVAFTREAEGVKVHPRIFKDSILTFQPFREDAPELERAEFSNIFRIREPAPAELSDVVPFHYSDKILAEMLSDTLGKTVRVWQGPLPAAISKAQTLFIPMPDTLYRRLMQDSDNFIAEQLLLVCSDRLFGIQDADLMLEYAKTKLMPGGPDEIYWNDGSGLSRYNLFTPRSVVFALEKLNRLVPAERLFTIFPAGGISGTIRDWYAGPDKKPFVFAKTGTLRNKHCLSGYLVAQSGKTYLFSFMHNNFTGSSAPIKKGMNTVLQWIREKG